MDAITWWLIRCALRKEIIHELQYNLLLCYTGNIHVSANIIKDQVKNYEKEGCV